MKEVCSFETLVHTYQTKWWQNRTMKCDCIEAPPPPVVLWQTYRGATCTAWSSSVPIPCSAWRNFKICWQFDNPVWNTNSLPQKYIWRIFMYLLSPSLMQPSRSSLHSRFEAAPHAVQGNGTKRITDRQELSDGPWMTKASWFNKLLVLEHQNNGRPSRDKKLRLF
jgi:hypothetical protein